MTMILVPTLSGFFLGDRAGTVMLAFIVLILVIFVWSVVK